MVICPAADELTMTKKFNILVCLFVLLSRASVLIESARTPKTLGEESDLEESLATRIIHNEERKESEHLSDVLGKDHLFNDIDNLIVENNRDNYGENDGDNESLDESNDKVYDNGRYDDNDSVEEKNYTPLGNTKARARTVNPIKKDTLGDKPENALKSIGFADTEDESDESVLNTKSKHYTETTASKKALSGQRSVKSKHGTDKRKSSLVHNNKEEGNPYEELYDEKELKSMKETLVSIFHW